METQAILNESGPTVRAAITATAAWFNVEPRVIVEKSRLAFFTRKRFVAMAVVRSRSSMSLTEIGRRFGGYDQPSTSRAIRRADRNAVAQICLLLNEVRA